MSEASPKLPKSVSMVVGHDDASLFRYVGRDRVRTVEPASGEPVDLILFACSRTLAFTETSSDLPASVWAQAARGAARVVFDASGEGQAHDPDRSRRLHGFLERQGVAADRAVYVTQDRGYGGDYAAFCAETGAPRRMRVLYYDYWIRRVMREVQPRAEALFEQGLVSFRARARRRERRFIALTFTPRPSKTLFLLRLLRDDLWDRGFVSFGGFGAKFGHKTGNLPKFARQMTDLTGFEDLAAELAPLLPDLDRKGAVVFGAGARSEVRTAYLAALDFATPIAEHDRSWFSVVVESEMMDRACRITEKPFRPLLNFHPFSVLGNPVALERLRELGFQTFPELFDEAYDLEPDPRRRFEMVYAGLRRLCALDEAELDRLEAQVAEKVVFNADRAMRRLPGIYRDRIDGELLADLCAKPAGADPA